MSSDEGGIRILVLHRPEMKFYRSVMIKCFKKTTVSGYFYFNHNRMCLIICKCIFVHDAKSNELFA
jgi:hypothetical protein